MASLEEIPDTISLARRSGLASVADRLDYLYKIDPSNGDDPINQHTARMLVSFMIEHPELVTDVITMGPDGCVHAQWNITSDNTLDAKFLPSGNVRFIYAVDDPDSEYLKVLKKGEGSPNDMFKAVAPFIKV